MDDNSYKACSGTYPRVLITALTQAIHDYQPHLKQSPGAHMTVNREQGNSMPQRIGSDYMVAANHGQALKGDCLNVTETRLGPVKACFAMPWVYMYLASLVITCKIIQVHLKI